MFGLGTTELIIIMVIALLLFGSRLPSIMRSMGQGITEFKKGLNDVKDDAAKAIDDKPADTKKDV